MADTVSVKLGYDMPSLEHEGGVGAKAGEKVKVDAAVAESLKNRRLLYDQVTEARAARKAAISKARKTEDKETGREARKRVETLNKALDASKARVRTLEADLKDAQETIITLRERVAELEAAAVEPEVAANVTAPAAS